LTGKKEERELKILCELMENSRKSDREIARNLGVSQPTVSRIRGKLEKEGYIKEYTLIPDFSKLGYKIMAITFSLSRGLDKGEADEAKKKFLDSVKNKQIDFVMLERGLGLGFDGVFISFHKDYASYHRALENLRQFKFLPMDKIDSFLIDLDDDVHYRPLTFSTLAKDFCSRI
jgi:DNA-binding Lrp family transcriptional regulator